ncbi:MAG: STAS domain-containing protein [Planctomycetota bacterium]
MEIREHQVGAVAVLEPRGALVEDAGALLRDRVVDLHRKQLGRLAIDAGGVPYIDSLGLEALLDASEVLIDSGRSLKLCGACETVREVLDLVGLASVVEQYENVQDAVRSFL